MQVVVCWKVWTKAKTETHKWWGARTEALGCLSLTTRNQAATVTKVTCHSVKPYAASWDATPKLQPHTQHCWCQSSLLWVVTARALCGRFYASCCIPSLFYHWSHPWNYHKNALSSTSVQKTQLHSARTHFTSVWCLTAPKQCFWFLHTEASEIPSATSKLHLIEYGSISAQNKQQAVWVLPYVPIN